MNHTTNYFREPREPRVELPLRISNLTLENFRLFRSFACEVPEQLVLIGANGAGKTSILNGLAAGLENLRYAICRDQAEEDKSVIRHLGSTQPSFGTTFEPQLPCKWKIRLKTGNEFQGLETTWGGSWVTTSSLAIESNSTETERETLPVLRYFRSPKVVESGDRKSEIARAFDDRSSRTSAYEGWNHSFLPLARLEAWALRERVVGQETGSNTGWELFCAALSTVMPAFRSAHFNASENALILVKSEGEVRATDLSEGERAVLGLVGDLVRRCFRLNAHLGSEVLLKSPGIILVDELDEHLHPALALTTLPALLEVFPAM